VQLSSVREHVLAGVVAPVQQRLRRRPQ
jgi:hypothetical protein